MPPPPRMQKIVAISKIDFGIWKKFHLFVELVETNPLMYNIKDLGQKTESSYSFEDRGTDGQTDRRNLFRNVLSKTFRMIYAYNMRRLP